MLKTASLGSIQIKTVETRLLISQKGDHLDILLSVLRVLAWSQLYPEFQDMFQLQLQLKSHHEEILEAKIYFLEAGRGLDQPYLSLFLISYLSCQILLLENNPLNLFSHVIPQNLTF